jgi:hypothetical protein
MATATEAPASTTAEGPTSHTPNQPARPSNTFGYTRQEQIEALHKLREPFKPEEIRFLPRMWCGPCKNSNYKGCQQHPRTKCGKCKQNLPGGHIDLRFVGHAEATNRLLNVDPFWDWEPLTVDERGLPTVDGYRGLWIRLTVCGMTRLGYGHAGDKTGGDAVKEVIGDAIRNAGMRFGMALDLWTSSDLEIVESGGAALQQEDQADTSKAPTASTPVAEGSPLEALMEKVRAGWNNVLAMEQNYREGAKHEVLDVIVPSKEGPMKFGDLMKNRINELKAAPGGNAERSAA